MTRARLVLLTTLATLAFAANYVLARLAFTTANAEPLSYTGIRLSSGAVVLTLLLVARQQKPIASPAAGPSLPPSRATRSPSRSRT